MGGRWIVVVVVLPASYEERSYLNTQSDYMPSPNAPRPHKQTTLSPTNTRNGPVAPQWPAGGGQEDRGYIARLLGEERCVEVEFLCWKIICRWDVWF